MYVNYIKDTYVTKIHKSGTVGKNQNIFRKEISEKNLKGSHIIFSKI